MIGLIITGHGNFATGLGSSLKLIAGEPANVKYVDFEESHSVAVLKENLNNALDALKDCDGVLILSDLLGGSPFKTSVECKFERNDHQIEVVAGTNFPLLVTCATMSGMFGSAAELADAAIFEGKNGMLRFELVMEEEEIPDEDGI